MKFRSIAVLAMLGLSLAAHAQERIRGTISGVSADTLSVKSRTGEELKLALPADVSIGSVKKVDLADIKPGSFIGTAAVKGDDGVLVAREVHVLPPNTNPGHRPYDLEPGSSMTNANVSTVMQSAKGRVLTLEYQGGSQKVLVPEGVPIVMGIPATRADLKVGEYVLVTAAKGADGKVVAQRVQVSKDGVRPPQ